MPDKKEMKLLQVNLNHCRDAQDLLMQTIAQDKIDVAIISEPYGVDGNLRWLRSKDGKAAIGITDKAKRIKRTIKGNCYVGVEIGDAIIISVYVSPNGTERDLGNVLDDIERTIRRNQRKDIIVAGDLNAWHKRCGATRTNRRGMILDEFMTINDLHSCRRGNEPTFTRVSGDATSMVDVMLANSRMRGKIEGWRVRDEETLSDHRYIQYRIEEETREAGAKPTTTGKKWAIGRLNKKNL